MGEKIEINGKVYPVLAGTIALGKALPFYSEKKIELYNYRIWYYSLYAGNLLYGEDDFELKFDDFVLAINSDLDLYTRLSGIINSQMPNVNLSEEKTEKKPRATKSKKKEIQQSEN